MHLQRRTRRMWLPLAILVVSGSLIALAGQPASAKPDSVNGHFSLLPPAQSVCPPDLPLGICMSGDVNGKIKGTFTFVPATFEAAADPNDIDTYLTTGTATVAAQGGTLECRHAGALQLSDPGPERPNRAGNTGPFVSLCVVIGGTGQWTGATGHLRITGEFTLDRGGSGSYQGTLVLP